MSKRKDIKRLKERVKDLENKLNRMCEHKQVNQLNYTCLNRKTNQQEDYYECSICKKRMFLDDIPKGSIVCNIVCKKKK